MFLEEYFYSKKAEADGSKKELYMKKISTSLLIAFCLQAYNLSSHTEPQKLRGMDTTFSWPVKDFLFGDKRPFLQCHASTLIRLNNDKYIAAWFGGTKEGANDVGIWMTKGKPGHWEKPFEVAKINNEPHWNPVLFSPDDKRIYLFFKVGFATRASPWRTWMKTSDDKGKTWSAARELMPDDHGGRGPVRNKPIVLSNGVWIAGASNEKGPWRVFFDLSKDKGETWEATLYLKTDSNEIKGRGLIQPTVWESAPGQVHALLRSTTGVICRSDSKDYGRTWSPAYKISLPNPNSAIDVTKLPDGTLVLAYNPDDKNWGSRGVLTLAISFDNGNTWPKRIDIENENKEDEFSYPAIISFGDTVAVTYTWKRKKIAFWMATKTWLLKNAKSF